MCVCVCVCVCVRVRMRVYAEEKEREREKERGRRKRDTRVWRGFPLAAPRTGRCSPAAQLCLRECACVRAYACICAKVRERVCV